jgi:hypothetical protein
MQNMQRCVVEKKRGKIFILKWKKKNLLRKNEFKGVKLFFGKGRMVIAVHRENKKFFLC